MHTTELWKPNAVVAAIVEHEGRFLFVEEEADGRVVFNQPAGHLEAFAKDLESMGPEGMQAPGAEKALFERHNMEIAGPPLPKKLVK